MANDILELMEKRRLVKNNIQKLRRKADKSVMKPKKNESMTSVEPLSHK